MRYSDLLEFCFLITQTNADQTELENLHVKPDGYIAKTFERILQAIRAEEDFDYRAYIAKLIDYVDGEEFTESDKPKRLLN